MIQKRNIAMYIILSIVTCGIFGIYWFICLTDDSKLAANDNESASGPVAFLLTIVTCGIYSWYWAYKLGDRVDYAANSRGIGDGSSTLLHRISSIKSQIMIHSTAMVIMDLMAVTTITTIILIIIHSTITMQLLIAHTAVIQIITHQIAVMLIMYLTMPIMTVHHMEALPVKNQVTVIQVVNNAPYGSPFDNDKSDN